MGENDLPRSDTADGRTRLVDGGVVLLTAPGGPGFLHDLTEDGDDIAIEEEDLDVVLRLALGLPKQDDDDETIDAYIEAGWAARGVSDSDEVVVETLEALGRPYRWQLNDDEDQDRAAWHRRIVSRRKVGLSGFGQMACLPESAAARVAIAKRQVSVPARVLLIGDDDLLGPLFAKEGYDTTVLDIDPWLVALQNDIATSESLPLVARQTDLLKPLDESLLNAFDLVVTDPMSHENCLTVFLGRGLAALKPGGLLLSCIHALGHRVLAEVVAPMPAELEQIHLGVSAYFDVDFVVTDYRSDLAALRRVPGELPIGGRSPMPDIDVTEESAAWPAHGLFRLEGIGGLAKEPPPPRDLANVLGEVHEQVDDDDGTTFSGDICGSHFLLRVLKTERFALLHVYPWNADTRRVLDTFMQIARPRRFEERTPYLLPDRILDLDELRLIANADSSK